MVENSAPVFRSLPDRLRSEAARRPDGPVLIDAGRAASFKDFDVAMDRIAATLQSAGVAAGEVIAICASSSIAYLEVFCGALRAGVTVAPLAPSSTAASLAAMLADCSARILFLDAGVADHLAPVRDRIAAKWVTLDDTSTGMPLRGWVAPPGAVPQPVELQPGSPFNIIYSSGTTGTPKGIVQPHVMRTPYETPGLPFGFGPETVWLVSTGLYSNTPLSAGFTALAGGGTLVLMAKFDARGFLEMAQQHRVTHAMLVPVQYQRILAVPEFDRFDLSSFQMKFSTSAPLSAAIKAEVLRRWPGGLTEYYGMTEGGGGTVLYAHETPDKLHTVGRPWPHVEMRLIDEEGREVAPGEAGEIVGFSTLSMLGYHNRPDATAAATWHDAAGRAFVRHGDMGRFDDDGFLILLDRKKDMIISGGFNVFPSDLESVLCEHPDVAEAAVVGAPSESWGETPIGFVTSKSGATIDAHELRAWANQRLGKTQRLSDVRVLPALPRSHIGKVLKRELRDGYRAQ
ncbi:MAG TPA: class I adenylate-forming enzyme family protein [Povalibacter sp.]|uniref:class I adenylate-forming enzyme family protein n=1 Tax=Povalibacter sp. TaxID=1962978 RepID=UPI002BB835C4|nr:class I adenylate-forming enzyme family protein [Povalibacter sp.]HMN46437.1 class I adenylate-forming enzyme family protein [Povalibacter sp.]